MIYEADMAILLSNFDNFDHDQMKHFYGSPDTMKQKHALTRHAIFLSHITKI